MLLHLRGHAVPAEARLDERAAAAAHLLAPGRSDTHRLYDESEVRDGRLYLCGSLVA